MRNIQEAMKIALKNAEKDWGEVASAAGISRECLRDILQGERSMTAGEMIQICRAAEIMPNDLLIIAMQND